MTTLNYWNQQTLISPRYRSVRPTRSVNWGLIAALALDVAAWAFILTIAI